MENNTSMPDQPEVQDTVSQEIPKRNVNKILIYVVALVVICGALFLSKSLLVAASVDGKIISRLSVVRQLEKQSGKGVLDSLIVEKLIDNEAKKKGVVVSNDEVNQAIKDIEASIVQQGGTLQGVLAQRGMTEQALRDQLKIQKEVEKLLADKIQVTDEEVAKYIKDNKVPTPKGKEADVKSQVAKQLQNQKLNQEAQSWLADLRTKAKITYYVNY